MNKKDLYLITGGAGHLGSALVNSLMENDCDMRVLCMEGEQNLPENVEIVYGDVCKKDTLNEFFANPDNRALTVIHCAGIVSISSKYDRRVYDVNVTGTKNITDLCVKNKVKKLIYVSSVHAIPEKRDGGIITEPDSFTPDKVVGLYAKTKAEATAYVFKAAKAGLDAEVVFPSGIIGPYDCGKSHTSALVADYVNRRLIAAIAGGYDFTDVRDVADGIIACINRGKPGEGYILSGEYHTIKEILNILHDITGQKEIRSFLPLWFVNMMAPMCELYYKMRRKPPLFTKYSIHTLSGKSYFSHEKAAVGLGYHPRNIKVTLSDTVEWLRNKGRIRQI